MTNDAADVLLFHGVRLVRRFNPAVSMTKNKTLGVSYIDIYIYIYFSYIYIYGFMGWLLRNLLLCAAGYAFNTVLKFNVGR
jgi:hypothetical protein